MKYQSQVENSTYTVEIDADGQILVENAKVDASLLQVGPLGLYSLLIDKRSLELVVEETQHGYRVSFGSHTFDVRVADERQLKLAGKRTDLGATGGDIQVKAPIPGLVVRVLVRAGDAVQTGQSIAILEAMKMENELRATREGVVSEVRVKAGERVEQGAILLVIH
ncbi:MAG: biotin/lipoyl-binding protein [Caldilineales bacterium]|nr:biotin/lipoyl-binding protein [Caldilineales bacterium]MCW5860521.1 biotin/lipoyl-binding protein [Caldilineales bacterium]